MLIGIHKDRIGAQSYGQKWSEFLNDKGVKTEFINLLDFKSIPDDLRKFDGIMWRWGIEYPDRLIAKNLLDIIESELKIPVYPDLPLRNTWDNKIDQFLVFKANKINIPETRVYYTERESLRFSETCNYPIVFKLISGAGSNAVTLIEDRVQAGRIIKRMFSKGIFSNEKISNIKENKLIPKVKRFLKRYIYRKLYNKSIANAKLQKGYCLFQEFIPLNNFDTRISIINGKAFGFRRFNRDGDFRASGSGKIDYDTDSIDPEMIKMAFRISEELNFSCMAYDFLKKEDKIILLEMCWTFNDAAVRNCKSYWDQNMQLHEGSYWPEELQVEYFLAKLKTIK